jgi:hypothetical protein
MAGAVLDGVPDLVTVEMRGRDAVKIGERVALSIDFDAFCASTRRARRSPATSAEAARTAARD